jgi:glycosyltransferase involved in cell wall biosynthesis
VIVPVHGWAPYLAETLDAILAQDPAPDEVVVVDDGSPEPLRLHPGHAARCTVVRRPERGGLPAARRTGFERLDTELVALCDADDVWQPGKLAAQLRALDASGADGCFARVEIIGPDDRPTGERWPDPPVTLPALYERNPVCVSGALLRRDAVRGAGGIARDMPAAEDWDLWLRLLVSGARLTLAQDAFVAYRRHPGAMSGDVATLALAQLELHRRFARVVGEAVRRRAEARDLRALGAGLTRRGDHANARAAYEEAARLEPPPPGDRARAAALAVPGVRRLLGRRDPYRGAARTGRPSRGLIVGI